MPIYEFYCENCGHIFEVLLSPQAEFPPCPLCNSQEVTKVPSIFAFQDKSARRAERERAILKRASDYLKDGKLKDAKNFLEKAKMYHPTDNIKRLSEALQKVKPPSGGFLIKPEVVITKQNKG